MFVLAVALALAVVIVDALRLQGMDAGDGPHR